MGPLLGGFLARPYEHFGVAGPFKVFIHYPYLLPCLISAFYNLLVLGASCSILEESNQTVSRAKSQSIESFEAEPKTEETDLLLETQPVTVPAPDPLAWKPTVSVNVKTTTVSCLLGILYAPDLIFPNHF